MPWKRGRAFRQATYLWDRHLANTHVHGLPHISRSEGKLRKAFWTVIFIVTLSLCLFHIGENFAKYASYPSQTRVELVSPYQLDFPAVTICNNNPIRETEYKKLKDNYPLWQGAEIKSVPENTTAEPLEYYYYGDDYEGPKGFTDAEGNEIVITAEQYHFSQIYPTLSAEEKFKHGHQLDTMLLSCAFGHLSHRCGVEDFTHTLNHLHGNCWTFNSGANNTAIRQARKPGIKYGLELELFIDQHEYTLTGNNVAGVRVVVQEPSYMPFADRDGISVGPGTATFIGVRKVEKFTTGEPYDECFHDDYFYKSVYNAWHLLYPHIGYSSTACSLSCYQWMTYKLACNCGDPEYPLIYANREGDVIINITAIPACNTTEELSCMYDQWAKFTSNELRCSDYCRPLCHRTLYNTEISFGQWPSIPKEVYVLDALMEKSPSFRHEVANVTSPHELVSLLRENTLKIIVYYTEFEYERIITDPSYLWVNLLSDQGGQVGLWVGLSMLSLFELVELLYDFTRVGYTGTARQVKKRKAKDGTALAAMPPGDDNENDDENQDEEEDYEDENHNETASQP